MRNFVTWLESLRDLQSLVWAVKEDLRKTVGTPVVGNKRSYRSLNDDEWRALIDSAQDRIDPPFAFRVAKFGSGDKIDLRDPDRRFYGFFCSGRLTRIEKRRYSRR